MAIRFCWISVFFLLFVYKLDAQSQGGAGSGQASKGQNLLSLNGDSFLPPFAGANGRGDWQEIKTSSLLDGTSLNNSYAGSNGRGDYNVSKPSTELNGEILNLPFVGGTGRGDILHSISLVSLVGEVAGALYTGANGRGDHQIEIVNMLLGGAFSGVSCAGGVGRGDNESHSFGEILDCTYYSIWTGTVSTAWENPANWQCGELPHRFSDVLIPTTVPNFPFITVSPVEIRNLTMDNSSMLHVIGVPLNVLGGDQ